MKKEVKDIRAQEAQMLWNMTREEKKERSEEEKAVVEEIRDWRWKQSDDMKAYLAELQLEIRTTELEESKEFQQFKREHKKELLEEEARFVHEVYLNDVEMAAWRAELARAAFRREQALIAEKAQDAKEIKEIKLERIEAVKAEVVNDRALDETLELAKLQRQLQEEKQKLLQSLEYTRSCNQPIKRAVAGRR